MKSKINVTLDYENVVYLEFLKKKSHKNRSELVNMAITNFRRKSTDILGLEAKKLFKQYEAMVNLKKAIEDL